MNSSHRRRGLSLMELIAASFLLAVVGGSLLPLFTRLDAAHQNNRQRQIAILELENLLERTSTIPFQEVSSQGLSALAETMHLEKRLPEAKFEVIVKDVAGSPAAKQAHYRILSKSQPDREIAALDQWFFPQENP